MDVGDEVNLFWKLCSYRGRLYSIGAYGEVYKWSGAGSAYVFKSI